MKKHESTKAMAEAISATNEKMFVVEITREGAHFDKKGEKSQKYGIYYDAKLIGTYFDFNFLPVEGKLVKGITFSYNEEEDILPKVGEKWIIISRKTSDGIFHDFYAPYEEEQNMEMFFE